MNIEADFGRLRQALRNWEYYYTPSDMVHLRKMKNLCLKLYGLTLTCKVINSEIMAIAREKQDDDSVRLEDCDIRPNIPPNRRRKGKCCKTGDQARIRERRRSARRNSHGGEKTNRRQRWCLRGR